MKITEFSPQEFDKLEASWKLLEKGTDMTWFQTYDWYKIVNKHFIAEKKKAPFRFGTYVLLSDDNDKPLLIAPIQVVKVGFCVKGIGLMKGFYFIGRQGFSDYLNFIYDDFKNEYLRQIFEYLASKYGMNYFRFENISSKCSSYKSLCDESYGADKVDSLCMSIEMMNSFEEYKAKWSKNMRGGMNQARNRAVKDGLTFEYEIINKVDSSFAKTLDDIRQQRLGKKQQNTNNSLSIQAKLYTTFRNLLVKYTSDSFNVMNEIENCWCLLSKCKNDLAAFFYCVYKPENKTVYFLLAGVDLKYERYKPGLIALTEFLKDEMDNGNMNVEFFDLTRGNERYKYDLKADELITSQFVFYL